MVFKLKWYILEIVNDARNRIKLTLKGQGLDLVAVNVKLQMLVQGKQRICGQLI